VAYGRKNQRLKLNYIFIGNCQSVMDYCAHCKGYVFEREQGVIDAVMVFFPRGINNLLRSVLIILHKSFHNFMSTDLKSKKVTYLKYHLSRLKKLLKSICKLNSIF